MKKYASFILALAVALLFLPSCASTGGAGSEKWAAYVKPAAAVATSVLMEKAVKEGRRAETAAKATEIATALQTLATSATGADVADIVIQYAGAGAEWQALGLALSIAYDQFVIGHDLPQKQAVADLSAGVLAGLKPYL
jgi:hypothetical protein